MFQALREKKTHTTQKRLKLISVEIEDRFGMNDKPRFVLLTTKRFEDDDDDKHAKAARKNLQLSEQQRRFPITLNANSNIPPKKSSSFRLIFGSVLGGILLVGTVVFGVHFMEKHSGRPEIETSIVASTAPVPDLNDVDDRYVLSSSENQIAFNLRSIDITAEEGSEERSNLEHNIRKILTENSTEAIIYLGKALQTGNGVSTNLNFSYALYRQVGPVFKKMC